MLYASSAADSNRGDLIASSLCDNPTCEDEVLAALPFLANRNHMLSVAARVICLAFKVSACCRLAQVVTPCIAHYSVIAFHQS